MRKLLALGCAVACLAFSAVSGAAHVHEAADHHDEMRGLHLDHAHVGDSRAHDAGHHHPHRPSDDGATHVEARHVEHHEGDARYVTLTAKRSSESGLPGLPATIAAWATLEPPNRVVMRLDETPEHPRGPPRHRKTPPRAPPV